MMGFAALNRSYGLPDHHLTPRNYIAYQGGALIWVNQVQHLPLAALGVCPALRCRIQQL
jgi:hypothetical protein